MDKWTAQNFCPHPPIPKRLEREPTDAARPDGRHFSTTLKPLSKKYMKGYQARGRKPKFLI
jgi:hypothetical protein